MPKKFEAVDINRRTRQQAINEALHRYPSFRVSRTAVISKTYRIFLVRRKGK